MGKIGQNVRLKADETAPYVTLGIAKVSDGFELRKVTISGTEVQNVKTLFKTENRAEVMVQMQLELSQYTINFNQKEMK